MPVNAHFLNFNKVAILYLVIGSTCSLNGSKRALTARVVMTTVPGSKPWEKTERLTNAPNIAYST